MARNFTRFPEELGFAGVNRTEKALSGVPNACPRAGGDGLPGFGKKLCENKDSKQAFVGLARNACLAAASNFDKMVEHLAAIIQNALRPTVLAAETSG